MNSGSASRPGMVNIVAQTSAARSDVRAVQLAMSATLTPEHVFPITSSRAASDGQRVLRSSRLRRLRFTGGAPAPPGAVARASRFEQRLRGAVPPALSRRPYLNSVLRRRGGLLHRPRAQSRARTFASVKAWAMASPPRACRQYATASRKIITARSVHQLPQRPAAIARPAGRGTCCACIQIQRVQPRNGGLALAERQSAPVALKLSSAQ